MSKLHIADNLSLPMDATTQKFAFLGRTGCHRSGQGILMFDGTIRNVEDVRVGDQLMGPDSEPRTVLSLIRGHGDMFEVRPVKGESFFVNDEHILTLTRTRHTGKKKDLQTGNFKDVCVLDCLKWGKRQKHLHKLVRVGVSFKQAANKILPFDPYFMGVLLGDGQMQQRAAITSMDAELKAIAYEMAAKFGIGIRLDTGTGGCPTFSFTTGLAGGKPNPIMSVLRDLHLWGCGAREKFIPHPYKTASREQRLELLAGLLDSDGYLGSGCYDLVSKSPHLAGDVAFVARSLGLAAFVRPCVKSAHTNHSGRYHRVSISGDASVVPCRILRKQGVSRIQKKNVLRTGFKLISVGPEDYYGFSLDGDGRYLLSDFTITHNSGKTYAATKLAEELLAAGAQIVALDPVGVWYGLRIASDGKSPGIQIPVFGGLHGDVPIEPTGGALMADLIVDRGISLVIDVSQFETDAAKARFATDFAARFFFRKKAKPSPVMVFLEEAQEFIPEHPQRDEALMLNRFTRLTKLGRNFGIGLAMISQRPQEVNKKCLNLTECMFAFQMTGPHERKTIRSWVEEKGGDLDIVDALPKFKVGEAHVWSPQWLQISKTVHVSKKTTFNSSSTPVFGSAKRTEPKPLNDADMEALKTRMAETIERAKAEDPRELRRTILELEKKLREGEKARPVVVAGKGGEVTADKRAEIKQKGFEQGAQTERRRIRGEIGQLLSGVRTKLRKVLPLRVDLEYGGATGGPASYQLSVGSGPLAELDQAIETLAKTAPVPEAPAEPVRTGVGPPTRLEKSRVEFHDQLAYASKHPAALTRSRAENGQVIGFGGRKILTAVAQYENGVTREQLTVLTGYKRSSRDTYLQRLRERDLVDAGPDRITATAAGRDILGSDFEPLPTGDALRAYWIDRLPEGERRILAILLDAGGSPIDKQALDEATGYKRSSRDTYLQRLRARELVEFSGRGEVRASAELFEDMKRGRGA